MIKENVQKHLGLFLDSKLNCIDYINEKTKKNKLATITFFSTVDR